MTRLTLLRGAALTLGLVALSAGAAEDFGMVMDLQGKATVQQQGKSQPMTLGQTLFVGDQVTLEANSTLVVVAYSTCDELGVTGPAQVKVEPMGLSGGKGMAAKQLRRLPVCYSPEELNASDSGVIGGLVLRGAPKDPVFDLRQDFAAGRATTPSLMTLIMHDVSNGNAAQAAPYFQALKQQAPNSRFVQDMSRYFP